MNVMREAKNFPFCSDLQSIVFFALFLVITIMIIIILLLLLLLLIIRGRWLDSCDPWLLKNPFQGNFSC